MPDPTHAQPAGSSRSETGSPVVEPRGPGASPPAPPFAHRSEEGPHPYRRAARIVATGAACLLALYGLWIIASYLYRGAQG